MFYARETISVSATSRRESKRFSVDGIAQISNGRQPSVAEPGLHRWIEASPTCETLTEGTAAKEGFRVRADRRITLLGRRAEAWSETIARQNFGIPITCHSGGTIAT